MKNIRKITALLLSMTLCLSLLGCSRTVTPTAPEDTSAQVVNPLVEMSREQLARRTGIDLPVPDEAKDPQWFLVDTGAEPIAELRFTLNDKDAYVRAMSTDETALSESSDISGLNYDWDTTAETAVHNRTTMLYYAEKEAGYIAMLDVVPGILYNFCMLGDFQTDELQAMAELSFFPLQGEADGDADTSAAPEYQTDEEGIITFADWKEGFTHVLTNCVKEDDLFSTYSLYDITGDGQPELFLRHGTCEADALLSIYQMTEDRRDFSVTELEASQMALAGLSGENAVLLHYGHMGVEAVDKLAYEEKTGFDYARILDMRELAEGEEYLPFTYLDYYEASDLSGLVWEGNPTDDNAAVLESIK